MIKICDQSDGSSWLRKAGGNVLDCEYTIKPYVDCDGCLLLSDEPDLLEIADYMEASGKKVWRQLSEIPYRT